MYKVFKAKGTQANINVINTDTGSVADLGKMNPAKALILEKAGVKVFGDDHTIELYDEWSFEVEDEIGKELARTMMTMRKPIRAIKTKAKEEKMRSMDVKIDESEQITPDGAITPESKCNAYDYLFGYTDELDD